MSPWVWVLAGFAALVLLYAAGLGIRILLYRFVDRRIASYQDDLVAKLRRVQNIYREMRGWRHDYHNHIQTMKTTGSWGRTRSSTSILQGLRLISPRLTHWSSQAT